jgi:hypothetical protein
MNAKDLERSGRVLIEVPIPVCLGVLRNAMKIITQESPRVLGRDSNSAPPKDEPYSVTADASRSVSAEPIVVLPTKENFQDFLRNR